MKKFLITSFLIFTIAFLNAQVDVAIKGGWNYATAKAVYSDIKQPTNFVNGYGIGLTADVPFDGLLHFCPSVMINNRGFIVKPTTSIGTKEQYSITYLDMVPYLTVFFKQKDNTIALGIGPDIAATNFGKLKTTTTTTTSQKLKFGYGEYGWFDLGLSTSLRYKTRKAFVEIAYLYGLASINNNEETDHRNIRNRMLSFNIGYYFKHTAAQTWKK